MNRTQVLTFCTHSIQGPTYMVYIMTAIFSIFMYLISNKTCCTLWSWAIVSETTNV